MLRGITMRNNNLAYFGLLLLLLLSLLQVEAAIATDQYEAHPPQSSPEEYSNAGEAPESNIRKLGRHRSWSDKSMAGGGVIIGGLVTAIFAAIFCYIRVTRRKGNTHDDHGYHCNNNCTK
ncbi:hypothetical protein PIB30_014325 [Stylosanthes scabra]|uniref:Transmembrane protein n=1 Tax=Stylosanthes scabra TaxID=79078 RepID=A0ABU6R6D3_9FABA|nr:hypothetical protein [Stylosanthes scabra]